MSACPSTGEQLCGCCTGVAMQTPEFIGNRPGLRAIAYRVGRHATFQASMQACLAQSAFAPLALLRTRDPADFSIGLIDSWAVVLDILSFYQERLANEAFLRTAVDQRSVFELARLIGYVPAPGVAATDIIAFTLTDAPGSPDQVQIPAGTRVQSVPGPNQKPQVFETSAAITAHIAWNALPAQTSTPWQVTAANGTWIQGTANNIVVGDLLLFIAAAGGLTIQGGPGEAHFVTGVAPDAARGMTRITWDAPLSASFPPGTTADAVNLYVFRKKAALYGVQAPNPAALYQWGSGIPGAPDRSKGESDWEYDAYVPGSGQLNLDAAYAGLNPAPDAPQWAVLAGSSSTAFFAVTAADESNPNRYTLTAKTTRLTLAFGQMLRGDTSATLDSALSAFEADTRNVTVWLQSAPLALADLPLTDWPDTTSYAVQPGMLAPVGGSSVSVVGNQQIADGQAVGVSGRRPRLQVLPGAGASFMPAQTSAAMTVADNQVFLLDAFPPVEDAATAGSEWQVLTTSGVAGALRVDAKHLQLQRADPGDPVASEAAVVATTQPDGDLTRLDLGAALTRLYDRTTVAVNANAVVASHGESVQELLGSGDAANPALCFTLKQSPLTYVSSSRPNGIQSTLQVWVNNLQWHEVPNLLDAGPADRVFVTRVDADGNTIVQFGDGNNGARTPTGQMNIRAVYRKGIGSAGMVAAGQLSQALDRPQGLKSAVNPSAAAGGADPATADDARARAPLPTLTIGRVVSLQDYRDYALNFGGIAKASAAWAYFNDTRGVFLSIAGADGAGFEASDTVVLNLTASLRTFGNPHVPIQVASYEPLLYQLAASVRIDDTSYDTALVLGQVWQRLRDRFSFAQRQLGQGVAASDLIRVMQDTPGVVAVQLTALHLTGTPAGKPPVQLCAAGPRPPTGAQLLLLDPACKGAIGAWS
ncbi:MAG: hypothetical protein J0H50_02060 [Xanthomonadales bacterium]|nr:hypothetical protein [Xanthomonadales bacterium]